MLPSGRDAAICEATLSLLAEVGYDLTTHESKSLDSFNGTDVAVAVTMGCGDYCPLVKTARRVDWNIPDPKNLPDEEFREVRDLIEAKVKELIASL